MWGTNDEDSGTANQATQFFSSGVWEQEKADAKGSISSQDGKRRALGAAERRD